MPSRYESTTFNIPNESQSPKVLSIQFSKNQKTLQPIHQLHNRISLQQNALKKKHQDEK